MAIRSQEAIEIRTLQSGAGESWDRHILSAPEGTPFHTTAWRTAVCEIFAYETYFLGAYRNGVLEACLPLYLVPGSLLGRRHLVSVAFGVYGGVVGGDEETRGRLVLRARELMEETRASFVELRHHLRPIGGLPVKDLYVTFVKELPEDPDRCLQELPRKARAAARKGMRDYGLEGFPLDPGPKEMAQFHDLFARNKRALGSPTLPLRFFQRLVDTFGDRVLLFGVRRAAETLAAVLSFVHRDTLIAYYAGVMPGAERMNISNVMYATLMAHAVRMGLKRFDFCRSRRDSGAARFKEHQGFTPTPLYYEYVIENEAEIPDVSPSNPRYDVLRRTWARLPLWVTKWAGPKLIRYLP